MKYEVFSSGGGCYHSCYRDGGYVYVVDSEFPECITCYNGDDWSSENMVFSYGISEPVFESYKELYERLLKNLNVTLRLMNMVSAGGLHKISKNQKLEK